MQPVSLEEATETNSAFTNDIPGLQLAMDSTSMGTFKECPRKYQLSIIYGWRPRKLSVHLTFGLHYHKALEAYDHAKAAGMAHPQALLAAVKIAMIITWDKETSRPWISDDAYKNRLTLIRSVVWYLDQFANDPLKTVILANGKPAVELSFRFELPYTAKNGQPFLWCGHLDRLVEFQDEFFGLDRKTTKAQISPDFFAKFSPDNQMSGYSYAGRVVWNTPVKGMIIDAAQVLVSGTRFKRGFAPRDEAQLNEWAGDLGFWLAQAQQCAVNGYWPMNDKSCGNYGGCDFRGICGRSPSVREQWLRGMFHKRVWDPLQVRGDI